MATMEDRVSALEKQTDVLRNDFAAPFREVMDQVTRNTTLLQEQGRDVREMKVRLATTETQLASMTVRLNNIDEKLETVNVKLDQIIALLGQER